MDPPPELGGEWLTEAERRDRNARTEQWRARQHDIRKKQAKEFESLNDNFNPSWPLDDVDAPSISPISDDDDSSIGSDDISIDSAACGPCDVAPEGPPAPTEDVASPPRNQAPAPPRRSKRLKGEKPDFKSYLAAHPDYVRCDTSLVTDKMRGKGFIQANKA